MEFFTARKPCHKIKDIICEELKSRTKGETHRHVISQSSRLWSTVDSRSRLRQYVPRYPCVQLDLIHCVFCATYQQSGSSFLPHTPPQPDSPASLERIALKPFTFTNGLHLSKDNWINTTHFRLLQDENYYLNPPYFDPLRHARMRDSPGHQVRCQSPITATSDHSMHFGHGHHACPGIHMASDEVKLAMTNLLLSFEFALFQPRPENLRLLELNVPNMTARIWLRQRKQ